MSEKMVKVKVLKPYKDMQKMFLFYEGEEHEVTERRAKELTEKGFVKRIPEKKDADKANS